MEQCGSSDGSPGGLYELHLPGLLRRFPLLAEAEVRAVCGDLLADGVEDLDECVRRLQRQDWRLQEQLGLTEWTRPAEPVGGDWSYAALHEQSEIAQGRVASAIDLLCDPQYLALRVVDETNAFRASRHLQEVWWSEELASIAEEHAVRMAGGEVPFSHKGFNERACRYSVRSWSIAENITFNSSTSDAAGEAVRAWIRSPDHRGSLEDPEFDECGVGVARASSGTFFFSQLLACASAGGGVWTRESEDASCGAPAVEVRYPETYLVPRACRAGSGGRLGGRGR
uniref:SCP domain-containing protein n=1 Tax=Alexandrium monilatum TaxID=311494 RepID=A0A7S4S1A8_9DINO